jgi:hypothetical protein
VNRRRPWIGFHIVRATLDGTQLPRAAIARCFEMALGMSAVAVWPPPWERIVFQSQAGERVTLHIHVGSDWTQIAVLPLTPQLFATHGAAAIESLFESLCIALDAHLARSFQHGGWGLVRERELGRTVDCVEWLQYFGPRRAKWPTSRRSPIATIRSLPQGSTLLKLGMDPFDPSWRTRVDAAGDLDIRRLRTVPEAALADISDEQRLRDALPPEPAEWPPDQRAGMLAARARTIEILESGMADSRLFARFRRHYTPGELETKLLDRIAIWFSHYGEKPTCAGLRVVARAHGEHAAALPFDDVVLEGCVKLVAWGGDDMPLAKRELLVEYHIDLPELIVPRFARNVWNPDAIVGMVKMFAAHVRNCQCERCGELRKVFARLDTETQA